MAGKEGESVRMAWQDSRTLAPDLALYAPYFSVRSRLITCHTYGRQPALADDAVAHLWQSVLLAVRRELPYRLHGYVTLPDHVHLLLEPPPGVAPEAIVRQAMDRFELDYRTIMGVPENAPVWHGRQRIDRLEDLETFAAAVDYLHFNPVQHALVARPEEWPHSSYRAWIDRRVYKLGWGWRRPRRIAEKHWE